MIVIKEHYCLQCVKAVIFPSSRLMEVAAVT